MHRCGLSYLLKHFGFSQGRNFHKAGNDANFTLRLLIFLALNRYMERIFLGMEGLCLWRLIALRAVAMYEVYQLCLNGK